MTKSYIKLKFLLFLARQINEQDDHRTTEAFEWKIELFQIVISTLIIRKNENDIKFSYLYSDEMA